MSRHLSDCQNKKGILVGMGMSFFVAMLVVGYILLRHSHSLPPIGQTASSTGVSLQARISASAPLVLPPIETHRFVDPRAPLLTWQKWPERSEKTCGSLRAAVVNHHILASDLLGRLFSHLSFCQPEIRRVIILSPDHFLRGSTTISTHTRSYLVGGRRILAETSLIQAATSTFSFVHEDSLLFEREHGIGALIPFIERAWPEARVASFAIRSDLSRTQAEAFAAFLKKEMLPGTLLIVSSDMSHYLSKRQALLNDEETRRAFQGQDAEFFWKATDDHTDNGKSLWLAMKALGDISWHEQDHRISSDYDGSEINTTSYLTGWWKSRE